MRIVIDLQGAQSSGSRNRGIGRYSTALALSMCRNRGKHEIVLALNGAFAESTDEIRQQFADILPEDAIRVFHPLPDVHSLDDQREAQREASAMAWEAFLASLEPDVVHVSSLFEGLSDDAVTSIGAYGFGTHQTVVTLYDLIPLINHERYLANPTLDRWYRRKIEHISRADLLLSISESSRQEGLEYLHFREEQIVNISTAADPQFRRVTLSRSEQIALRERHGINRPFIMYTGGIDQRKNIEGLICAYALMPEKVRSDFALAVVCSCHEDDRTRLLQLAKEAGLNSGDLVMTGFVPEDELIALYSSCRLFVFPSWHEGFGLPALEAMWCGAPVIASNLSSLPEVIGWADAMFDPLDSQSIADKLEQALTDEAFSKALVKHGAKQRRKFSWDETARTALTAIERLWSEAAKRTMPTRPSEKPRLAYVSPIPPARSGIADYSAELIPELARYYRLDLIVPDDFDMSQVGSDLRGQAEVILSASRFAAEPNVYDRVLYHFGNSDHHTHMFGLLEKIPGVVVLHDFFLSGILAYWQRQLDNQHVWYRALYRSHGYQALASLTSGEGTDQAIWRYPSNREVLDEADGIIVHSEHSQRLARQWVGKHCSERFTLIPLLRAAESDLDRAAARRRIGFAEDDILICSFGFMAATKHARAILDAWLASQASDDPRVHLIFVGQKDAGTYGATIDDTVSSSPKGGRVHITGWTEMPVFRDYLRAADIAVQLRTLSRGETSAAVLDCMNFGLPTIVNANGSMADLPDNCVLKLDDNFTHGDLVEAIDRLAKNSRLRSSLGQRARRHIQTVHDPSHCALRYFDAIESFSLKSQAAPIRLAERMRRMFGAALSDADCRLLAERLDWNAADYNDDGRILISIPSPEGVRGHEGWRQGPLMKALRDLAESTSISRIEPIYWSEESGAFRYARGLMLHLLDLPIDMLTDDFVEFRIGDSLLDLHEGYRSGRHAERLAQVRRRVSMSYHVLSSSSPTRASKATKVPKEIQAISTLLKDAGWRPI